MSNELYLKKIDENNFAWITLNRPEIHNAFNDEMILSLISEFKKLENDDSVRGVILTGEGKSFCAGADLNWMKKMVSYSFEQNVTDSMNLANLFEVINYFKKPVIGLINGAALGGGLGLVAVCDHVIAVDSALFGLTEVKLGLIPAVISPYVISKIGESQARSLFISGKRIDATEAKRIGLVHEVVAINDIDNAILTISKEYKSASPAAQITSKKLIFDVISHNNNLDARKKYTCEAIAKKRISQDGQEGMNALLEKRKPNWM